MCNGLVPEDKILREIKVTSGAKILVVGSTTNDILAVNTPKDAAQPDAKAEDNKKEPLCRQKQHRKVLDKGKPKDVMPSVKRAQERLPKNNRDTDVEGLNLASAIVERDDCLSDLLLYWFSRFYFLFSPNRPNCQCDDANLQEKGWVLKMTQALKSLEALQLLARIRKDGGARAKKNPFGSRKSSEKGKAYQALKATQAKQALSTKNEQRKGKGLRSKRLESFQHDSWRQKHDKVRLRSLEAKPHALGLPDKHSLAFAVPIERIDGNLPPPTRCGSEKNRNSIYTSTAHAQRTPQPPHASSVGSGDADVTVRSASNPSAPSRKMSPRTFGFSSPPENALPLSIPVSMTSPARLLSAGLLLYFRWTRKAAERKGKVGPVVPRALPPRAYENEVVTGPRMTPRHHCEAYSSAGEEEEEEEEEKVRGGGGGLDASPRPSDALGPRCSPRAVPLAAPVAAHCSLETRPPASPSPGNLGAALFVFSGPNQPGTCPVENNATVFLFGPIFLSASNFFCDSGKLATL
ncbi:hypothetical protein H8959_005523 [Pygathrix nigripes]